MVSKEKTLQLLQKKWAYLHNEFGITKIGIFGSFAVESNNNTSDVDIIVEFEQPIGFRSIDLAEYLEDLLGRKVDILTPVGIQAIRAHEVADSIKKGVIYV